MSHFYHLTQYVISMFFGVFCLFVFLLESRTPILNDFQRKNSYLFKETDSSLGLQFLIRVLVTFLNFWWPEAYLEAYTLVGTGSPEPFFKVLKLLDQSFTSLTLWNSWRKVTVSED